MKDAGDDSAGWAAEDDRSTESRSSSSPYESPGQEGHQRSETDPSVFAEPWLQTELHPPDTADPGPALPLTERLSEDQSVWDEPGLSPALAGETPSDGLTWYRWYQEQVAMTSGLQSWLTTLGVVLVSGVFAVFGTFAAQSMYAGMLTGVTVIGPTTEEIMKIALVLWLVEKRPWLFRDGGQILLCALASGLAFAAVENVIYLNIYVPGPSPGLVAWRWTICVLLHAGCSTIAGFGAHRIWREFQRNHRAPILANGASWIVAAIVIHGLYNGTVTLMELSGLDF
jgi:hypothetical protein